MDLMYSSLYMFFFFFNDTATTEIYTLSLHDALPIFGSRFRPKGKPRFPFPRNGNRSFLFAGCGATPPKRKRSEEHTSELQSLAYLVCRLLLEKKKPMYNSPLSTVHFEISITSYRNIT